MKKIAVLTYDLRILCMENDKLVACSLNSLSDLSHVVTLKPYSEGWNFISSSPENWWYDIETGRFDCYAPEGSITIQGDSYDKGICRFRWTGNSLHVTVSGHVETHGAEEYRREYRFRLLDMDSVHALWRVMKRRWVLAQRNQLVRVVSGESSIWDIHFGCLVIDFEDFIAAVRQRKRFAQKRLLLVADRNVYYALPYRPAVFYSLTSAKKLKEFSISLQSLIDRGEYKGEICIATSLQPKRVEVFIPKALKGRYHFVRMQSSTMYDKYMPMLASLASGVLDHFSPVCCLESSVLVTKSIDPLLRRAVKGHGISAPIEVEFQNNEQLKNSPYGVFLYKENAYDDGLRYELNASITLFPSVKKIKYLLVESMRCSAIYVRKNKNALSDKYEKNLLHYIAFVMNMLDLNVLNKKDCDVLGQATPGKVDSTFLCCEKWLESHRVALMQSHLESLPRVVS